METVLVNIFTTAMAVCTPCVYYDATKNKIGKIPRAKGFFNIQAGMWGVATLLLWILVFPAYLIKRSGLLEKTKQHPKEPIDINLKLGIFELLTVRTLTINFL